MRLARGQEIERDLAEALELRDELLVACRTVLLGVASRDAAGLVAHIDALLDLQDERSPGSRATNNPVGAGGRAA